MAGGYHVGQCKYCTFPESAIGKHCLRFDHKLEGSVTPKVFTYCHKNSEWVPSLNKLPNELPKVSTFAKPCIYTHNLKSQKRIKTEAKQALLIYWLSSQSFPCGIFPPQAAKIVVMSAVTFECFYCAQHCAKHFKWIVSSPWQPFKTGTTTAHISQIGKQRLTLEIQLHILFLALNISTVPHYSKFFGNVTLPAAFLVHGVTVLQFT